MGAMDFNSELREIFHILQTIRIRTKFQNFHQCSKTFSGGNEETEGRKGKMRERERGTANVDNYAQRRALQLPGCVAYALMSRRACEKQTIERLARSYGNGTSWKRHGDEKFDEGTSVSLVHLLLFRLSVSWGNLCHPCARFGYSSIRTKLQKLHKIQTISAIIIKKKNARNFRTIAWRLLLLFVVTVLQFCPTEIVLVFVWIKNLLQLRKR